MGFVAQDIIKNQPHYQWQTTWFRFSQNLRLCTQRHIWKRLWSFLNQLHCLVNWLVVYTTIFFSNKENCIFHLETLETKLFSDWNPVMIMLLFSSSPVDKYIVKVNNRNTRTRCETCSKLTIKTSGRRCWLCSGVFFVNFEHISHLVLASVLLTFRR